MTKIVLSERLKQRFKGQLPALEDWCVEQEKSLDECRGFKRDKDGLYTPFDPSRHPKGSFVVPSANYKGVKIAGLRLEDNGQVSCCFLLMEEFKDMATFVKEGHFRTMN